MGQKSLEINSTDPNNLNNMGLFFSYYGNYKDGITYYDKAIQMKSDYLPALGNKTNNLVRMGKLKDALKTCDEFLKIDANNKIIVHNKTLIIDELSKRESWPAEFRD